MPGTIISDINIKRCYCLSIPDFLFGSPTTVSASTDLSQSSFCSVIRKTHMRRTLELFSKGLQHGRRRMELSTGNEDWRKFLELSSAAFAEAPSFKRHHSDPEKREKFAREYFKYIYKTELSNGRAGLATVKTATADGPSEIIYAMCATYNRKEPTEADRSAMLKIDKNGAEASLREDDWVEVNIHRRIRHVSEILDLDYVYGNYHVTAKKFHGMGLSKRYFHRARQMLYDAGRKRGVLHDNRPSFHYALIDDVRLMKAQKANYKHAEILHLHFDPDGVGVVCADDPNAPHKSFDDFNCMFVVANEMGDHTGIIPVLKQMLSTSSKR